MNSPKKGRVTRKMFLFDDVIMIYIPQYPLDVIIFPWWLLRTKVFISKIVWYITIKPWCWLHLEIKQTFCCDDVTWQHKNCTLRTHYLSTNMDNDGAHNRCSHVLDVLLFTFEYIYIYIYISMHLYMHILHIFHWYREQQTHIFLLSIYINNSIIPEHFITCWVQRVDFFSNHWISRVIEILEFR